jgi:hypothetical protein
MFAMTMTLRIQGPFEAIIRELEATPSARRRVQLIHKLALSHMTEMIDRIIPFLGDEPRVRHAAVRALVSFGEDARRPMLDLLGEAHRRELHPGAVLVLAGIVRDQAGRAPVGWRRHDRGDCHLQGVRGQGVE